MAALTSVSQSFGCSAARALVSRARLATRQFGGALDYLEVGEEYTVYKTASRHRQLPSTTAPKQSRDRPAGRGLPLDFDVAPWPRIKYRFLYGSFCEPLLSLKFLAD
jgi:hypothetical protein